MSGADQNVLSEIYNVMWIQNASQWQVINSGHAHAKLLLKEMIRLQNSYVFGY